MSEQPITSPSSTHLDRYRTAEGGWVKDAPLWTVAYRKPRANRFLRVELALTWHAARELAGQLAEDTDGLEIYYTTSADAELAGYGHAEDHANILVDSGRRVRILEGGTLPAATAAWLAAQAQIARRVSALVELIKSHYPMTQGREGLLSDPGGYLAYLDLCDEDDDVAAAAIDAIRNESESDHAEALDEDEARYYRRLVEETHGLALVENAVRARLAQTKALGFVDRVKDARDAALRAGQPIGIIEGMQAVRDEDHDRARAEDTHRFGRAVGVAGFRRCVRSIRADRARGFNDPVTYRRFREAMHFYAQAVRLHDRRILAI